MHTFYVPIILFSLIKFVVLVDLSPQLTRVWGPGLKPDEIVMPARYFFIQAMDSKNNTIENSLPEVPLVKFEGITESQRSCRIWTNVLDRKDGSYIVRYKMYDPCINLRIVIKYKNIHLAESPYVVNHKAYPDECNCPLNLNEFATKWDCEDLPFQVTKKFDSFEDIDWDKMRDKVIEKFDKPLSVSICHYVIKNNQVHRKCYGKYVGFSMFMDSILWSLARKVHIPDLEFFVNLGDWPLSTRDIKEQFPILSWCGSKSTNDIVMPTYELTQATLEIMGKVMLDMLSVQGNVAEQFEKRIPKLFWRGRDSNRHRLDLITIARDHPDLFNASLTNFFFYRDEEHVYGPKTEHVSFFKFSDYKYQLAIDGTVASYRVPYLLGGGSLMFKQDSMYYEHFYNDLQPNFHYIPVKKDLSNLVDRLKWALENDKKAKEIASNGQKFANKYLLPKNIFCYHVNLFKELKSKIVSPVRVLEGMELVSDPKVQDCDCYKRSDLKDEL